jgi:TRAP-type C4-dicarboxylate transport system substrate-binding protein
MSLKVWDKLPPSAQAILERSMIVWDDAMKSEITAAEAKGADFGKREGIDFVDFPAADQAKLDEIYTAHAEDEASKLSGAEAEAVLHRAQEIIALRKSGVDAPCKGPAQ